MKHFRHIAANPDSSLVQNTVTCEATHCAKMMDNLNDPKYPGLEIPTADDNSIRILVLGSNMTFVHSE
jgi:hypothetical protein